MIEFSAIHVIKPSVQILSMAIHGKLIKKYTMLGAKIIYFLKN